MSGYVSVRLLVPMLINEVTVYAGSEIDVSEERAGYLVGQGYAARIFEIETTACEATEHAADIGRKRGRKPNRGLDNRDVRRI